MKRFLAVVLCLFMVLSLTGCDFWMNGNYSKVVPHDMQEEITPSDKLEAYSYGELKDAMVGLVLQGAQEGVIYYPKEDSRTLASYMDVVSRYIMNEHPVGAYAVSSIEHEIGTNGGVQAVAVTISYARSIAQIRNLQSVEGMAEAKELINGALEKYEPSVVFFTQTHDDTDLVQYVRDYVDANPDVCMELPLVSVMTYPEFGVTRVVELVFSYQTSRDTLRSMQQDVAPVFESAELYVSGNAGKWEKYAQLYSFLMERHNYTLQTSITPAYSLLRHGVGDSKAFAVVYATMCRRAGLSCDVVSGTKDSESYTWNVIRDENTYYFVDLLYCSQNGRFLPRLASEMDGYVWDYDQY